MDLSVEVQNAENADEADEARGLGAVDPDLRYLYEAPPEPTPFPRRLRWARALLPAGGILMASGAIQLAAFAKNRCYDEGEPRRARWSGGVMAAVGLGLTVAGTFSLVSVPEQRRAEHSISRRRRRGAAMAILGSFFNVLVPALTVGLIERVVCASS